MIPPAVSTFMKGYAMGAANVIPGVSGGTVAFITGIFETLINQGLLIEELLRFY